MAMTYVSNAFTALYGQAEENEMGAATRGTLRFGLLPSTLAHRQTVSWTIVLTGQ